MKTVTVTMSVLGVVWLAACGTAPPSPVQDPATRSRSVVADQPAPTTPVSASPRPLPSWPAWTPGAVELYNLDEDPLRAQFITDPRSHRTDWQMDVQRPREKGCSPRSPVVHVTVTFWFLDDRQAHWFPSQQRLALVCGHTAPVQASRTVHGPAHWLFQPDPPAGGAPGPDGVVMPSAPAAPNDDRLPLGTLWITADRPVHLVVRWRTNTPDGRVSAWSRRRVALPAPDTDGPGWARRQDRAQDRETVPVR